MNRLDFIKRLGLLPLAFIGRSDGKEYYPESLVESNKIVSWTTGTNTWSLDTDSGRVNFGVDYTRLETVDYYKSYENAKVKIIELGLLTPNGYEIKQKLDLLSLYTDEKAIYVHGHWALSMNPKVCNWVIVEYIPKG